MSEHIEQLVTIRGRELLRDAERSVKQVIADIETGFVPDGVSLWELEQMMRRDVLYAMQHPEWGEEDGELNQHVILSKYIWREPEPGSGGEPERRVYPDHVMLDPKYPQPDEDGAFTITYEWLLEIYNRCEKWAGGHLRDFHLWSATDDLDRHKRFISERTVGLETAFGQLGVVVRYNTRAQCEEIRHVDGSWHKFDDRTESALREIIALTFCFARRSHKSDVFRAVPAVWSNAAWRVVLNAALFNVQIDPFVQWLEMLAPWDGTARLDSWLSQCGFTFDASQPGILALEEWSARSILMAACQRTLVPGTKHDTIPVLIGPQSIGKSSALAWLFPEHERLDWFSDTLRLSADEKRRVEALQGAVIVEVAEMTGSTTADIESLKAFLSRTNDYIRLTHRLNPEAHPRRCSMAGTANPGAVLPNDPTGNRRFVALPITSGSVDQVRAYLDEHREQLWAEAWERVNAGEPCFFPKSLEPAQTAVNELHRSADVILEESVVEWLRRKMEQRSIGDEGFFLMRNAAKDVGIVGRDKNAEELSQRDMNRLGRVLARFGCRAERRRVDGAPKRVWLFPEHPP